MTRKTEGGKGTRLYPSLHSTLCPVRPLLLLILTALAVLPSAHAQLVHDATQATVTMSAAETRTVGGVTTTVFESGALTDVYDGVAMQGASGDAEMQGWVRFGADGPWEPLYLVRSATGSAFLGAFRDRPTPDTAPFTLRFETRAPYGVTLTEVGTFDRRRDAVEPLPEGAPGVSLGKTAPTLIPPHLTTRAEWNAAPFIGTTAPLAPTGYVRLTFHHAAGFGAYTKEEALAQVKAIQEFHQNGRGWSDIGYQFVMDQSGRVYQGRPFLDGSTSLEQVPRLAMGAHVGGANTGNIGVCVLGCYHPDEPSLPCTDRLSPAALDSLVTLFAFLSEAYVIDPAQLMGHRDQSETSCPGDNNYALLPEIRAAMVALQASGNGRPVLPDGYTLAVSTPHPVRDDATLRYYLDGEGFTDLLVYDAMGREVARPVARVYQDGGRWYDVPFDASGLASGTYFVRLRAEGFKGIAFDETRTLVVVR